VRPTRLYVQAGSLDDLSLHKPGPQRGGHDPSSVAAIQRITRSRTHSRPKSVDDLCGEVMTFAVRMPNSP
jgi:hypothetical protein